MDDLVLHGGGGLLLNGGGLVHEGGRLQCGGGCLPLLLRLLILNGGWSLVDGGGREACACEFVSGLGGGSLSRHLCACSHVDGKCIGTHSELNPQTIGACKH